MNIVKVISTKYNDIGQMMTKLLRMGKSDVQEVLTSSLPGIDSVPVKDDIALFEKTGIIGENVIVGFLVKDREAEPGELKLYSRDANGAEIIYQWFKANGEIHFGGSAGNLTRFQELETAFDELKMDFNNLVNVFNAHTHPSAPSGPVSTPTPGPGVPVSPSTADITGAKIDELKTL